MELDPLIQKALIHLISRKPDSTEKLKQMLYESLGREYTPPEPKAFHDAGSNHDKLSSSSSNKTTDVDTEDEAIDTGGVDNESTDVEDGPVIDDAVDADDFAFDMGISCVICRQFDVSSNNQLIECQECHSLYHQLCHVPAVNDSRDVTDPRFVWYCHKCSKSTKDKISTKKLESRDKPSSPAISDDVIMKSDKALSKKNSNDAKLPKSDKLKAEKQKEVSKSKKHKLSDKHDKAQLKEAKLSSDKISKNLLTDPKKQKNQHLSGNSKSDPSIGKKSAKQDDTSGSSKEKDYFEGDSKIFRSESSDVTKEKKAKKIKLKD